VSDDSDDFGLPADPLGGLFSMMKSPWFWMLLILGLSLWVIYRQTFGEPL
jgi:hypothetical protein